MQISFPKVYELLLMEADFIGWDDEFFKKATGGSDTTKELADALQRAASVSEPDWDENGNKYFSKWFGLIIGNDLDWARYLGCYLWSKMRSMR